MLSSFFGPEERRLDPEDGQVRTYAELQRACAGKYSEQEIKAYWETQCRKQAAEGDQAGDPAQQAPQAQQMYSVVNDPFMTAGVTPMEQQSQPQNPAIAGGNSRPGRPQGDSQRRPPPDRFQNIGQSEDSMASRKEQLYEEMVKARRHWTEVVARLLGPGDTDRKTTVRNILVLAPWLTFMWVLLLWVLLRHYSLDTTMVLTALLGIASAALVLLWIVGKRWGPVSLLALGALSFLAVCSGTVVGSIGWHTYWRQYWWLQTGSRSERNSAGTPAAGLMDAAIIGFWDDLTKRTVNNTHVDSFRSAGYKDKHFYCVAPILSPATAEGTLMRVNFWAVGMDCCQPGGSFFCDDSRKADAGYGLVMLDEGFPCPDCHEMKFKAAVNKAEALHDLVSVPDAKMVRWVKNPVAAELGMLWKAVLFILVSGVLSFCVLGLLGVAAWYFGIGKRTLFGESSDDGARQKLLA